jgi:hypothetical protein
MGRVSYRMVVQQRRGDTTPVTTPSDQGEVGSADLVTGDLSTSSQVDTLHTKYVQTRGSRREAEWAMGGDGSATPSQLLQVLGSPARKTQVAKPSSG